MSSIKRHNHRIHPCTSEQKAELLQHLLTCNESSSILIVTADDPKVLQELIEDKSIIVTNDEGLADFPELKRDIVISYDLPSVAQDYSARIAHATTHALTLLEPKDQIHLYPIETLMGRTLMQEVIKGFEPDDHKEQLKSKRPVKINDYNAIDKRNIKKERDEKRTSKSKGKRISIKAIKPKESDDIER